MAVLAGGSCVFTTLLVLLQIHHGFNSGSMWDYDPSFAEFAVQLSGLAGCALLFDRLAVRLRLPVLGWAGLAAGGVAMVAGLGLIVFNPALTGASVGRGFFWNGLLPAYAIPAALAAVALAGGGPRRQRVLAAYALLAMFTYVTLMVRQAFHPDAMDMDKEEILDSELWAYSGAWLALGATLMLAGWRSGLRGLRLAALALVALVAAKVFLVDMAGLGGLWRVLSFLGLGLSLIGLGAFYRRFVVTAA